VLYSQQYLVLGLVGLVGLVGLGLPLLLRLELVQLVLWLVSGIVINKYCYEYGTLNSNIAIILIRRVWERWMGHIHIDVVQAINASAHWRHNEQILRSLPPPLLAHSASCWCGRPSQECTHGDMKTKGMKYMC